MDGAQDDEDRTFARVLGQELRTARETKGWTRIQLVEQLPSGIGDRTLLTYEHGIRQLTVTRFVEICRTLGVAASEILDRAQEKARDLRAFPVRVSLTAVLRDQRDELEPIRFWAQRRIEDSPSNEILLSPTVVRELAAALGFSHAALARYLVEFSPDDSSTT